MTRLARRASSLVALFLLASAATAYAECAWVLWSHGVVTGTTTTDHGWRTHGAFPAHTDCMKAAENHATNQAALYKRDPSRSDALAIQATTGVWELTTFAKSGEIVSVAFPCLPDTLDPRGAKGK